MTYSCYMKDLDRMLTCLAVSEKPGGPFIDLYTPWFDLGYSAIDADIFVDDDGTPYVYFSKNGMQDTLATGEIKKRPFRIDGGTCFYIWRFANMGKG